MLQAIALTKQFDQYTALRNLDLRIPKGEIFCLLGQNGAGKTTTINLFLGFIKPTSGSILINGEDITTCADPRKHTAYIPEVVMLYGNLSALENLDFFSRIAGFKYSTVQLKDFLGQAGLQAEAFEPKMLR
jgi:ABC-2 type transport system ATP-binding protein